MSAYFTDYDKALDQMAKADQPDICLILEPDMYGTLIAENHIPNLDASQMSVVMSAASLLAGKPFANTLKGYCEYMVDRARTKVPHGLIIGHLLNHWAVWIQGDIGHGTVEDHRAAGEKQGQFLNSLGAIGKGDVFFVEKKDRDAGLFLPDTTWF